MKPITYLLIALTALLLSFAEDAFAVYKCSDGKGNTLYSDTPCTGGSTQQNAYGTDGRIRSGLPERVDFGRSRESKREKATAVLESIRIDGKNCEQALKADVRIYEECSRFVDRMRPGAEWTQVHEVVLSLLNDAVIQRESAADYTNIRDLMAEITAASKFAEVSLTAAARRKR